VPDDVVFGCAIWAWFPGAWKGGGKCRSSGGLDCQRGEDAVWWALVHIMEEWAKGSRRTTERTDDTIGPTPTKPATSGPPRQPGPPGEPGHSGQPEHLAPDSCICTPAVIPTHAANATPGFHPRNIASPPVGPLAVGPLAVGPLVVGPLAVGPLAVGPLAVGPRAVDPPGVGPLVVFPLPVGPLPVGPLPVGPLGVGPLPVARLPVGPLPVDLLHVADTLGGVFGSGFQRLDEHNPLAKWVAQS